MALVWYILIHVSLGLIGWQVFTITNQGVLAACAAGAGVQAWPIYEMYRLTWPHFEAMRDGFSDPQKRKEETRAYCFRLGRLYIFRISAFTLITIFVAWLMRG